MPKKCATRKCKKGAGFLNDKYTSIPNMSTMPVISNMKLMKGAGFWGDLWEGIKKTGAISQLASGIPYIGSAAQALLKENGMGRKKKRGGEMTKDVLISKLKSIEGGSRKKVTKSKLVHGVSIRML